ncbi:MAG: hypothetical protein JNG89_07850 [Planctomycetaceae bacterium]|nr:hypothetical protein [Planctomycetaceae bacterium]
MSVMNAAQVKVVLPRSGPDQFWTEVYRNYAGEDQRIWKYLAMFTLRVNGGWTVDHIGRAFGHPKGHVTRCLRVIERELRSRFAPPDDLWHYADIDDGDADDVGVAVENPFAEDEADVAALRTDH